MVVSLLVEPLRMVSESMLPVCNDLFCTVCVPVKLAKLPNAASLVPNVPVAKLIAETKSFAMVVRVALGSTVIGIRTLYALVTVREVSVNVAHDPVAEYVNVPSTWVVSLIESESTLCKISGPV